MEDSGCASGCGFFPLNGGTSGFGRSHCLVCQIKRVLL